MGGSSMSMEIILTIIVGLLVNEIWAWIPCTTRWLLHRMVRLCFEAEMHDRMIEEWDRHILDTPGNLMKSVRALDLCRCALVVKAAALGDKYPIEKLRGYYHMWLFFFHMFIWTAARSRKRYQAFLATFLHVEQDELNCIKCLPKTEVEKLGSEALLNTVKYCVPEFEMPTDLRFICVMGKIFFTQLTVKIGNPLISKEKAAELSRIHVGKSIEQSFIFELVGLKKSEERQ